LEKLVGKSEKAGPNKEKSDELMGRTLKSSAEQGNKTSGSAAGEEMWRT